MSFLTPLYILGALAVAGPLIFHLIRRAPRGQVPFSSLMFLAPTPPRLTRRSRLDQILLLMLRASALVLLALAFARPFLREVARLDLEGPSRSRVLVLIDTSASLRRAGLWDRAKAQADAALAACRPDDQVAVVAFDDASRTVLSFTESAALDPGRRQAVARARVAGLTPGWGGTRLDQALIDAVGALQDVPQSGEKSGRMPRRVVLVSDLQQGSKLDGLGDFEWPSDVELELKTVGDTAPNAGLQWLDASVEVESATDPRSGGPPSLRFRVSNDAGARVESFKLQWSDAEGKAVGGPVPAYVPPGENRVVRVPRPAGGATLRLAGDAHEFDNSIYLAPQRRDEAVVLFVGRDAADDPAGLLYFLDLVYSDAPGRTVRVAGQRPDAPLSLDPIRRPALVVVAGDVPEPAAARLRSYLESGGSVLSVPAAGRSATLGTLAGVSPPEVTDATTGRDRLLTEIAFDHPLFAPMAGPQFNDFTKIRFWKTRKLAENALGGVRVLARFEGGDPALLEKTVGRGRLFVMASSWAPADSQLARSSKFVPLMAGLLNAGDPGVEAGSLRVHDPLPLRGAAEEPGSHTVHLPDGKTVNTAPALAQFGETDTPGVYSVDSPGGSKAFAVNLDPSESRTASLGVETLEQFGVKLVSPSSPAEDAERRRQLQSAELEGRQKLWRWLILGAVGVLIVETWLAGRLSRRPAGAEAVAT